MQHSFVEQKFRYMVSIWCMSKLKLWIHFEYEMCVYFYSFFFFEMKNDLTVMIDATKAMW